MLLARLGGGEVQPAEGAVLRVREGFQRAVDGDPGQRQALGVDELGLGGPSGRSRVTTLPCSLNRVSGA